MDGMELRVENVPLEDIKIGQRFRRDEGDVKALSESIKTVGLLQPIGLKDDNELVYGERRYRACQRLGWTHIPAVRVIGLETERQIVENRHRKDLTQSEKASICRTVLQWERKKAKERKAQAPGERRGAKKGSVLQALAGERGEAYAIAGRCVGWSKETTRKAVAVLDSNDPELVRMMDTRSIHAAHEEMQIRRRGSKSETDGKEASESETHERHQPQEERLSEEHERGKVAPPTMRHGTTLCPLCEGRLEMIDAETGSGSRFHILLEICGDKTDEGQYTGKCPFCDAGSICVRQDHSAGGVNWQYHCSSCGKQGISFRCLS